MKSVYLVFSEGSEMEIISNEESYQIISEEYVKYMQSGEQETFSFNFENDGELLINFDELVAIYAEELYDDEEYDDDDDYEFDDEK